MAKNLKRFYFAILGFTLAACATVDHRDSATAYLVRHAEKLTGDALEDLPDARDPPLTLAGEERAVALADLLAGVQITKIWSTDTKRTRDTAKPLADRLGMEIDLYDASDLSALAAQLKENRTGSVLIVGHSNTTPGLAEALGAEPGPPIIEATDYDRLYVIDLRTGEGEIQRFGSD